MRTFTKSVSPLSRKLLLRAFIGCFLIAAFSLAAIPSRAGDAEADAKKAFETWKAAKEEAAAAQAKAKDANDSLQQAMAAVGTGKLTAAQEALLANRRRDAAKAAAELEAAEAKLLAARMALEKAISELPDDSEVKKDIIKKRNALGAVSTSQQQVAGNVSTTMSGGLRVVTFNTLQGEVIVNLPDDMRAGDTISGTVTAEAKGRTPDEQTTNATRIQTDALAIFAGDATQPRTPIVIIDLAKGLHQTTTFTVPAKVNLALFTIPNENSPLVPCSRSGSLTAINESCSPISQLVFPVPEHPSGAVITPDPKITPTFIIPPLGQTGRPMVITGPFDGNSANTHLDLTKPRTDFEKNTENVSGGFGLIAESPRQAVFQSPEGVTGPVEILLREGSQETKGTYRNVGVNLTAPKTSLLKGETTELHVEVNGLQGLTQPVPLTLESHGVITMVGGMYQPLVIQPNQVGADGRYTTTRGITGVQTGGWTATATVVTHRFDFCLQDGSSPQTVILVNTFTGDYIFQQSGSVNLGGSGTITRKDCVFTLSDNRPDRRIQSTIDPCRQTGSASVQVSPPHAPKVKFTIIDRNTSDNTCAVQ